MSATGWTLLTPTQARVLAVLVEKRHTVPDTYPMSLLALTAGCNQRTSRVLHNAHGGIGMARLP